MQNLIIKNKGSFVPHPNKDYVGIYISKLVDLDSSGNLFHNNLLKMNPASEIFKHTHDRTEVMYIINGKGKFFVSGDYLEFETGDVLVAPAGNEHGMKNDSDQEIHVLCTFI